MLMNKANTLYTAAQKDQRDQHIIEHISLVKRIAYHLITRLPSHVQVEDLIQSGMVGLIEAAKNYDPSQGASFETYAGIRVRGAMLDDVRHADWSPRSLHKKMRQVREAIHDIENKTGRDAKDHEVANELNISLDEYYAIKRDSSNAQIFSLDQSDDDLGQQSRLKSPQSEPLESLQNSSFKNNLARVINELSTREQMVMSLYYNEELNLKEIGLVMEVSESRVSQIHSQALKHVRSKMMDWIN
ncbi:RNA polymerase sigma factor for flagellar operon [hydrothermal vent metagenome]|uniref:RNA polymerase sigma factor for flagellar operon n=1 Tax=hydrothermal vent metagenome TaxID=652676 RepID=A0A3B0X1B7_9ZZZZ